MVAQLIKAGSEQFVLLPLAEYEQLAKAARILVDGLSEPKPSDEPLPTPTEGESRLRTWRKYRGLTLKELGAKVGKPVSFLSQIEVGRSLGKPQLWQKLAKALNTKVEEILPPEV